MKFFRIREQKIVFKYFKQNVRWLCLENNSFKKNAKKVAGCTIFCFFRELDFVCQNNYMLHMAGKIER